MRFFAGRNGNSILKKSAVGMLAVGAIVLGGCSQPTLDEGDWANQADSSSEETSASSSTEETTTAKNDGGREAKDFKTKNNNYVVESADKSVICGIDGDDVFCSAQFVDPPIYFSESTPSLYSNAVKWQSDLSMFQPIVVGNAGLPSGGSLKEGEKVNIDGTTVEQIDANTIQVTHDGHWFKVAGGEYYSDSFPQEKDATGHALNGTVCGTIAKEEKGFLPDWGYVYATKNGTDCVRAMEVFRQYISEATQENNGARLLWQTGDWSCGATSMWSGSDTPEDRHPNCSSGDSGIIWVHPQRG